MVAIEQAKGPGPERARGEDGCAHASELSVNLARTVARAAESFGVSRQRLLHDSGLTEATLLRRDGVLPLEALDKLWALVADRFHAPEFVEFARLIATPGPEHLIMPMARNSTTLRHAWSRLARYSTLLRVESDSVLIRDNGHTAFRCRWPPDVEGVCAELSSAATIVASETWTGWDLEVLEVRFQHRARPSGPSSLLGHRLVYAADANEIVVPDAALNAPLLGVDLWLGDHLEAHARALIEPPLANVSFEQMVRARIRETLGDRAPTVPVVAKRMAMSARTLQRKLACVGLEFGELLDEARRDLALVLIRQPHISVYEVASKLGYRDLQCFRDAFQRWTGMRPRDYRLQVLREGSDRWTASGSSPRIRVDRDGGVEQDEGVTLPRREGTGG